jgi:acetyl-CoA carboxylase biotin carboxyl carrier protein
VVDDTVRIQPNPEDDNLDQLQGVAGLVERFIAMMEEGGIERLEVSYAGLSLSLRAKGDATLLSQPATSQPSLAPVSTDSPAAPAEDTYLVTAPMIGTYYATPAPNEPPFVQPGDQVREGQTIAIIEAMKIMNEIAADRSGQVVEMLAKNGEPVEYGSPLIRIRPELG